MSEKSIERRAIRIVQSQNAPIYLFALAAHEVELIADITRIGRDDLGNLIGYQRPEKRNHVRQILDYLDSDAVLFPNSLILAFSAAVRFRSSRGPGTTDGLATSGTLEIPIPGPGELKPAWIVDGQQRSLALARTRNRDLPVPVAGFIAEDLELQREQFLRVNTVQPLPSGLVNELLPEVATAPSPKLAARKLPSALVDMLNQDSESPFHGLIRRASTESSSGIRAVVTDTSLVRALEESLESPSGALFPFRNFATNVTDTEGIRTVLLAYWRAVRATFPDAWGKPSTQSRLMHGVGIRSMGRLMDRVLANVDMDDSSLEDLIKRELARIEPFCHWVSGDWEELGLPWDELQNTPRHISALSNYLIRRYIKSRGAQ